MIAGGPSKLVGGSPLESRGGLLDISAGSGDMKGGSMNLVYGSGCIRSGGSMIVICYIFINEHGYKTYSHRRLVDTGTMVLFLIIIH